MGSWAAYQEGIADLPVFKRARHGIHFKRPDGQIEASFSGKPCHYEDGGAWRPIDTKPLLLGDGKYGCPHSPVRIAADGTVSIEGAKYAQRARLINGKNIVQNDDHLVRAFSNGEQRLYITEDGFRSEITLFSKPNLGQALYLVANVSGKLPGKYVQNPTTMTDAAGNIYTYDTAANFRTWLEEAVYPVVIDPDFSGQAKCWRISCTKKTNYAEAIATHDFCEGDTTFACGQQYVSSIYYVHRDFMRFDTSTIGSGSLVSQVNLKLVCLNDYSTTADFDVVIKKYNSSQFYSDPTNSTYQETAYDNSRSADNDDNIWRNTSGMSVNTQYASGNLSTSWINKNGITYYSLISSRDIGANAPTGNEVIFLGHTATATESYRPVLTVTYSAGGIAIPVVQYYYDRLRRK